MVYFSKQKGFLTWLLGLGFLKINVSYVFAIYMSRTDKLVQKIIFTFFFFF